MLNVVAIMGRLGADPEMRQTTTGKNVCSFRIAVDRGRKDANGQSIADWFDAVAWEHTAEFVCKYFQKGSMIAVDGRLQTRSFQDKNGNNRNVVEILVNNASFCGGKNENGTQTAGNSAYAPPARAATAYQAPVAKVAGTPSAPASDYSAVGEDDLTPIDDDGDLPF